MQDDYNYKELEELAKKENLELFKISSVTGEGVEKLIDHVTEILKTLPKEDQQRLKIELFICLKIKNKSGKLMSKMEYSM